MPAELREDDLTLVETFRVVKDAADTAMDNATSGTWYLFEASRMG